MNYIDRWIASQVIATATLFVLMAVIGIPRQMWLDLLHMWVVAMALNNVRLIFSRDRRVG